MSDHPLIDFANVNGGPIIMDGPYSIEVFFRGGPLDNTWHKVPLDHTRHKVPLDRANGHFAAPFIYRVGQIPALGSPGSVDAHFKVHTYQLVGGEYVFVPPEAGDDEWPDLEVMRFYKRFEAIVYVGAVVIGVAIVAGLWFWVNEG